MVGSSALTGCAEVKTLFSVLWNGASSLNTNAFEVDEMKSGNELTCSVLGNKTLRCLGTGAKGDLGRYFGAPVSTLKEIKQVALGKDFTCVIAGEKSEVFCFGRNDKGQLGNFNSQNTSDPVPVLDSENSNVPIIDAKQIAAGENHACALLKNGRAVCWGDNLFGQAGNPSQSGVGVKTIMEGERNSKPFQNIHEIFAGANSTCIIAKDGNIAFCFGERYGSTKKLNWLPEQIELSGNLGTVSQVKQIGVGRGFACALSKSSEVFCWGRNDMNQLGALVTVPGLTKATQVLVSYPVQTAISKIDSIAVSDFHACALHRDEKTVYCWGDNRFGQLGNTSVRGLPEQVALGSNNLTLKGVRELSVGPDRTCIISSRDEVFCWGNGANGLLGNEKVLSPYPVRVLDTNGEMLGSASQISVGNNHSCVIDTNQKLFCFGINEFGQMGTKMIAPQVIGSDLKPIERITTIDTSGLRTCMIYGVDQSVACFGDKEMDNLNQKYELNSFMPEEIKNGLTPYKNALAVSIGHSHLCIITAEQHVDCLGEGVKGQLGAGENLSAKSATVQDDKKNILKDVWQIKSRENWNCALKQESGAIWCWGEWNNDRWLTARQIAIQGKPSSDVIQIAMTNDQICGIHGVERAVYCTVTGEKFADKLDLQPMIDADHKILKRILAITGGKHHSCALDEEGKVYCWGSNEFGQLGNKSVKESSKAIKITFQSESLKKVSRISAGDTHTCVSSPDEAALYCFGQSFFGGVNSPDPVEYPL